MATRTYPTALGRSLLWKVPSNRLGLIGWFVALLVLVAWSFFTDSLTTFHAVLVSIAVFGGWAASRELDPDKPMAAVWTLGLALVFALWSPAGGIAVWVTVAGLRLISGSVGAALRPPDVVMLAGIGFFAILEPVGWLAAAMVLIWLRAAPEVGPMKLAGTLVFVAGGVCGAIVGATLVWDGSPMEPSVEGMAYVLAAAAGAAMLFSARPMVVTSRTDSRSGTIHPVRVRFARLGAGSACLWAAVVGGVDGFWTLGPIFAALILAAIYRVFVHAA